MADFWDQLLDTVKDVAPTVVGAAATVATGGNPAAGAIAASIARKIAGRSDKASIETVASDIMADPDKLLEFRSQMRKAELEELRIRAQDVHSARELMKVSKGAITISAIVIIGYLAAVAVVMTTHIPETSQSLAYLLLGNLGTGFGMVLTFWLGSSVGSKEKSAVMAEYMRAAEKDQAARARIGK